MDLEPAAPAKPCALRRFCGRGFYQKAVPPLELWASGIIVSPEPPKDEQWDPVLKEDAFENLKRWGHHDFEGWSLTGPPKVTELRPLPQPPPEDRRPLLLWKILAVVSSEELRFDAPVSLLVRWPEKPQGETLDVLKNILAEDVMALRGHHQSYAEVAEILSLQIEPAAPCTQSVSR